MSPSSRILVSAAAAWLLGGCSDGSDTQAGASAQGCGASGGYEFVCGIPNAEDLVAVPDSP